MSQASPAGVHCYTNPSFSRQSEFMSNHHDDLPPPPSFQTDDLPPPPPPSVPPTVPIPIQSPRNYSASYGHTNPVFVIRPDPDALTYDRSAERYCYLDETPRNNEPQERRVIYDRSTKSRYVMIWIGDSKGSSIEVIDGWLNFRGKFDINNVISSMYDCLII